MPGVGPHHSHALNDCAVVTRHRSRTYAISRDFLASGKPTRGLEPRTPSLRVIARVSPERMVEPNLSPKPAPCATRVPICATPGALGGARRCSTGVFTGCPAALSTVVYRLQAGRGGRRLTGVDRRIAWRSSIAGLIRGAVDSDQLVEIERAWAARTSPPRSASRRADFFRCGRRRRGPIAVPLPALRGRRSTDSARNRHGRADVARLPR
jgi:hypothetical protein